MRNGYLGGIVMSKKKSKKVIYKNEVTVTLKSDFNKSVAAIRTFKDTNGIDFYSFQPLPDMKHWK
jgi:hypothetical protein